MAEAAPKPKKANKYTDEEYDDMLMIYNMTNSSDKTFNLYKKLYPKKHPPGKWKMYQYILRYHETGSIKPVWHGGADKNWDSALKYQRKKRQNRKILQLYTKDPTLSLREYSRRLGIGTDIIKTVLVQRGIQVPSVLVWEKIRKSKKPSNDEEPLDLPSKVIRFYKGNPKKSYLKVAREFETSLFTVKRILIEAGIVQHESVRRPCPKRHKAFNPPIEGPAAVARKPNTEECKEKARISDSSDDDEAPLSVVKSLKYGQESQDANILTGQTESVRRPCPKRHKAFNEVEGPLTSASIHNTGECKDNTRISDISHDDEAPLKSLKYSQEAQDANTLRDLTTVNNEEEKEKEEEGEKEKDIEKEEEQENEKDIEKKKKQEKFDEQKEDDNIEKEIDEENVKQEDNEKKEKTENVRIKSAIVLTTRLDDMVVFRQDFDIKLHPSRFFRYVEFESKPSQFNPEYQNVPWDWEKPGCERLGKKLRKINKLSSKRKTKFLEPYMPTLRSKVQFCRSKRNLKLLKICDPVCCQLVRVKQKETVDLTADDNNTEKEADVEDFDTFEIMDSSSDDDAIPSAKQPQDTNTDITSEVFTQSDASAADITIVNSRVNPRLRMVEIAIRNFNSMMNSTKEYEMKIQFVTTSTKVVETYDISLGSVTCIETTKLLDDHGTPAFASTIVQYATNTIILLVPICCWGFRETVILELKQSMQQLPVQLFRTRHECSLFSCSCCPDMLSVANSSMDPMPHTDKTTELVHDTTKPNTITEQQDCGTPKQPDDYNDDGDHTQDMPETVSAQKSSTNPLLIGLLNKQQEIQFSPIAKDMNIIICSEADSTTDKYYVEILDIDSNGLLSSYIRKNVVSASSNVLILFKDVIDMYKRTHFFKINSKKRLNMLKELKNMKVAPSIIKFINRDYSDRITKFANTTHNNNKERISCNIDNLSEPKKQDIQNIIDQGEPASKYLKEALKMPKSKSLGLETPKLNETSYAATQKPTVTNFKIGKTCKIPTTSYYKPADNNPALPSADKKYVLTKNQHRDVILVPAQLNNKDNKPTNSRPAILRKRKPAGVPAPRNTTETPPTLQMLQSFTDQNIKQYLHKSSTHPVIVPSSAPVPASRKSNKNLSTLPIIINHPEPNVHKTVKQDNINHSASVTAFANKSGSSDRQANLAGLANTNAIDDVIAEFIKSNKNGGTVLNSLIDTEVSKLSKSKLQGVVDDSVWNQIDIESQIDSVSIVEPTSFSGNHVTSVQTIITIIKDILNKFKDIELTMNTSGKVNVLLQNKLVGTPNFEIMILLKIIKYIQSIVDKCGLRSIINKLPDANIQNQVPNSQAPNKELSTKTNKENIGNNLANKSLVSRPITLSGSAKKSFDIGNKQKTQVENHIADSITVKSEKVDDDDTSIILSSEDEDENCNLATLIEVIPKSEDTCIAFCHTKPNESYIDITELTISVGNKEVSNHQEDQPSSCFGDVPVPFALKSEDFEEEFIKKESDDNIIGSLNSAFNRNFNAEFQNQPTTSQCGFPGQFVLKCEDGGQRGMATGSSQINFPKLFEIKNESDSLTELPNSVIHETITGNQYQPITQVVGPVPFILKREDVESSVKEVMEPPQINFPKPMVIKNECNGNITEIRHSVTSQPTISTPPYQHQLSSSEDRFPAPFILKREDCEGSLLGMEPPQINFPKLNVFKKETNGNITEVSNTANQYKPPTSQGSFPVPIVLKLEDTDDGNVGN